jgi:hypothetical protein
MTTKQSRAQELIQELDALAVGDSVSRPSFAAGHKSILPSTCEAGRHAGSWMRASSPLANRFPVGIAFLTDCGV